MRIEEQPQAGSSSGGKISLSSNSRAISMETASKSGDQICPFSEPTHDGSSPTSGFSNVSDSSTGITAPPTPLPGDHHFFSCLGAFDELGELGLGGVDVPDHGLAKLSPCAFRFNPRASAFSRGDHHLLDLAPAGALVDAEDAHVAVEPLDAVVGGIAGSRRRSAPPGRRRGRPISEAKYFAAAASRVTLSPASAPAGRSPASAPAAAIASVLLSAIMPCTSWKPAIGWQPNCCCARRRRRRSRPAETLGDADADGLARRSCRRPQSISLHRHLEPLLIRAQTVFDRRSDVVEDHVANRRRRAGPSSSRGLPTEDTWQVRAAPGRR